MRCEAVAPQVRNGSYVPLAEAEEPIGPMVLARLGELREELARGPAPTKAAPRDVPARREKLLAKRERYLEAFADGHMSREELRASMVRIEAETLKLDAEEAASRPAPTARKEWRREALRELGTIALAWERAAYVDGRLRRTIVNSLAIEVRIARDELPAPTWRPLAELFGEVRT
jgi:hypothetical protein